MKILVTGKNGFVSRALCQFLREQKETVVTSSQHPNNDPQNIFVGPFKTDMDWSPALVGVHCVVHLAARVHVMREKNKNPEQAFMAANYEATKSLAEAAHKNGVKKFIFLSTIFVNGSSTGTIPFSEKDIPNPQNAYARSKLKAEEFLLKTYADTKMEVIIVRPPMIYGKGAKGNWESLVKICKIPVPLPFKSFDSNKRNFIYIGNLVDVIYKMICSENKAGLYTVCDNESVSTHEFVRHIRKSLGVGPWLFRVSFIGKMLNLTGLKIIEHKLNSNLVVDNSKASKSFKWTPQYTLAQGVKVSLKEL